MPARGNRRGTALLLLLLPLLLLPLLLVAEAVCSPLRFFREEEEEGILPLSTSGVREEAGCFSCC